MARVESDADSGSTSSGGDSGGDEHSSLEHKLASTHAHSHSHPHSPPSPPSLSPSPSNDESITSSESESEDDATLEQSVAEAEEKITKNPYVYVDHVRLLTFLHKLGDVSRMRNAYERLSGLCPMSPSQWLHWLKIEVATSSSLEERRQSQKLFKRAFIDCYSIHIYTEWCAMSLSNGEGEKDARSILNDALRLAGSDPIDGAMLWDTAREFELALLYVMDTSSENYGSQVMRIFDIFNKQLSRPLLQAEKTVEEFRRFVEIMEPYIPNSVELAKNVEDAHTLSEKILKKLLKYENELEYTESNETKVVSQKNETYLSYISYVKSLSGDDTLKDCDIISLLGVLYDRITSECFAPCCRGEAMLPSNAEKFCLEYVDYAREYGSDEYCLNVIEKVIRRYHRNSTLWMLKLQELERLGRDFKEIKTEFEASLVNGFDTAEDYVALWLCYLEILRRKTDFSSSEQIEVLRKTFRLSWDSLSQMWGDEADKEFTILQYWARVEYHRSKDYKYGEELFKEILDYGDNKLRGGLWMEYMRLELHRGGESRARAVFRSAVKSSPDPRLQHAWLALERDFGTLDTLVECNKTCSAKAEEWSETQSKNKAYSNTKYKSNNFKGNATNSDSFNRNKSKKKGYNADENDNKKSMKRRHDDDDQVSDAHERNSSAKVRVSNPKQSVENSFNHSKSQMEPRQNLKRKCDSSEDSAQSPVKKSKDSQPFDSESSKTNDYQDEEKNSRTVFISNLGFKVDEAELKEKLNEYGSIVELRLISGVKSYGSICYGVYTDINSVDVALAHDRTLFNDRPMFISRYCDKDNRKKHFSYSTGIEKNKLFVKNISFEHCKDESLREIFGKCGELKDIRIVTHKTGKPKGLAYVEYTNAQSAAAAVTSIDGMELGGRCLNVSLSAPPPKKLSLPEVNPTTSTTRTHARTQLFIPAVIQKSAPSKSSIPDLGESNTSKSKLTNNDFKNMLLADQDYIIVMSFEFNSLTEVYVVKRYA
ncbi:spliceosome associated factor 3, U4/U6 recycling protein-like [Arctopsyche grandis]|uniref:spliceosome associated factor 3, U4/U6 recycling protein-like n=1 Tax=Arctopsyche grandis TaxID=121162 RepID=UPI00406D798D